MPDVEVVFFAKPGCPVPAKDRKCRKFLHRTALAGRVATLSPAQERAARAFTAKSSRTVHACPLIT